jgi:GDP/UDP-N,N'-diacetylbacillosamine 2-epimerase (hydrolysing)
VLHTNSIAFTSLGQLRYYSCIQFVNGVVGNSSSGLIEVPSFKKGTVNIGDRQRGRLKANSIIDCESDRNSIRKAIKYLFSQEFQMKLHSIINPYHNDGGSQAVIKILEEISFKNLLKKKFHDI